MLYIILGENGLLIMTIDGINIPTVLWLTQVSIIGMDFVIPKMNITYHITIEERLNPQCNYHHPNTIKHK